MIYLDNNATTPLDPRVCDKMTWFLKEHFGNPSSLYPIGRDAREFVTEAREIIASALGASRSEIVFTGSGTESDNFAIRDAVTLRAVSEETEEIDAGRRVRFKADLTATGDNRRPAGEDIRAGAPLLPVGRRLDFLMQEFNREANTLASKSADSETTAAAVELKVLIEQMREQVQNVE